MKRFILFLLLLAAFGGIAYWIGRESGRQSAQVASKPNTYVITAAKTKTPEKSTFTPSSQTPVETGTTPLLEQMNAELTQVVSAIQPSVVNLELERKLDRKPPEGLPPGIRIPDRMQSVGSGVIISHEGHIITNAHVVSDADSIKVTLFDDREYMATVVGADVLSDVAVLRIEAEGLHPLPWGDSDHLRIGEMELALGNPLANKNSVSTGIISATGRHAEDRMGRYENYIQTDASVNPGNSGGALVNIRGELIGINTAIATQSGGFEGISYAIPSKLAKFSVESLLKNGRVIRGYLGVQIYDIEGEEAKVLGIGPGKGVMVVNVRPDTPAERAKLKAFDVITAFNGEPVRDVSELRLAVSFTPVGEETEVEFFREGEKQKLPIVVDEMPSELSYAQATDKGEEEDEVEATSKDKDKEDAKESEDTQNVFAGLKVEAITDAFRKKNKLPEEQTGVVVTEVPGNWTADKLPIKDDVITEIRTGIDTVHPVTSMEDYQKIIRQIAPAQAVHVVFLRPNPKRDKIYTQIGFLHPEE